MSGIVYGLFDNKKHADQAVEFVQKRNEHVDINAFVHTDHLRDEDVQFSGTLAVKWAAFGGLMVGLCNALIAALILVPQAGMTLSTFEFGLLFAAGSLFGIVAGAVAGASESRREIKTMAEKLHDGAALVTVELQEGSPLRVVSQLEDQEGALQARAA
jgi:ABC-type nickel/cobalt efflux system permease component RcnA